MNQTTYSPLGPLPAVGSCANAGKTSRTKAYGPTAEAALARMTRELVSHAPMPQWPTIIAANIWNCPSLPLTTLPPHVLVCRRSGITFR